MPLKEKPLPQLPGRAYKSYSKYWNTVSIILLANYFIFKFAPSPPISVYLIVASIGVPLLVTIMWKPLVRETLISPTTITVKYDSGKIELIPLKECVWFISQITSSSLGKAYSYKLDLLHTQEVPDHPEEGYKLKIKNQAPVTHALTPGYLRNYIQAVHSLASLNLHIVYENEQMEKDYESGTFVDLKKRKTQY